MLCESMQGPEKAAKVQGIFKQTKFSMLKKQLSTINNMGIIENGNN
jgi:hypothetical protein